MQRTSNNWTYRQLKYIKINKIKYNSNFLKVLKLKQEVVQDKNKLFPSKFTIYKGVDSAIILKYCV